MSSDVRWSSIWRLAFPIILSNITVPLLGAVDTAVMGHLDHAAYLGAIAVGALIFDYIYWGFGFLRLSTTGLTAQALGRDDMVEARATFARASVIALIGALGLWVLQSFIIEYALIFMDASDAINTLVREYFVIRIWSAPAALMNYILIGWLLAAQNTKAVLYQQIAINLSNIVLDLVFVLVFKMDVAGVAIATVLAQYIGLFVGLVLFKKQLSMLDGQGSWDFSSIFIAAKFKRLMAMNMDLLIRTICLLSAFAWFTKQGARQSDLILAANAVLLQFQQFTSYALDGFAHAVEVLGARAFGRKDHDAFKLALKRTTIFAGGFAITFSLFYFIFSTPLISIFSDIETLLETAETYAIWMVLLPIVSVWSFQLDGLYFGLTRTDVLRNWMIVSLGIFILLSLFLQNLWDNHGLWAAFLIFMGVRALTLAMSLKAVQKKAFQ